MGRSEWRALAILDWEALTDKVTCEERSQERVRIWGREKGQLAQCPWDSSVLCQFQEQCRGHCGWSVVQRRELQRVYLDRARNCVIQALWWL